MTESVDSADAVWDALEKELCSNLECRKYDSDRDSSIELTLATIIRCIRAARAEAAKVKEQCAVPSGRVRDGSNFSDSRESEAKGSNTPGGAPSPAAGDAELKEAMEWLRAVSANGRLAVDKFYPAQILLSHIAALERLLSEERADHRNTSHNRQENLRNLKRVEQERDALKQLLLEIARHVYSSPPTLETCSYQSVPDLVRQKLDSLKSQLAAAEKALKRVITGNGRVLLHGRYDIDALIAAVESSVTIAQAAMPKEQP